jgi:hypothetical protein
VEEMKLRKLAVNHLTTRSGISIEIPEGMLCEQLDNSGSSLKYFVVPDEQSGQKTPFSISVYNKNTHDLSADVEMFYENWPLGIFRVDSRKSISLSYYTDSMNGLALYSPDDNKFRNVQTNHRGIMDVSVEFIKVSHAEEKQQQANSKQGTPFIKVQKGQVVDNESRPRIFFGIILRSMVVSVDE